MIRKLRDNVLVIWEDGSSTSTLLLGKDCGALIDSSLFPEKARKLKKFASDLGSPIRYVVNTHYHPDHTFGNSAFEDSDIIASLKTKEAMENMDYEYITRVWGEEISKMEHLVIPNVTFEDEKRFNLCGFKMFLKTLGGHTPDSTVAFLEREGILVAGDLVFNGYHAEITHDSDLGAWLDALNWIRRASPFFVVPGHGEPSGLGIVSQMRSYIKKIADFVKGSISSEEILSDSNFSSRDFPELFSYSIENLIVSRS